MRRSLTTTALFCLTMGLTACTGGDGTPQADGPSTPGTAQPSTGPSGTDGTAPSPSPTTHVATADDGSGETTAAASPQPSPSSDSLLGRLGPRQRELRPATTLPAGRTTTVRTSAKGVPTHQPVYIELGCRGGGRVTVDTGVGGPSFLECNSRAGLHRGTYAVDPGTAVRVTVAPGVRATYRSYHDEERLAADEALLAMAGEEGGEAVMLPLDTPSRRVWVSVRCDGDGTLALRGENMDGRSSGAVKRLVCDGTVQRVVLEAPTRFDALQVATTTGVGHHEVAVTRIAP